MSTELSQATEFLMRDVLSAFMDLAKAKPEETEFFLSGEGKPAYVAFSDIPGTFTLKYDPTAPNPCFTGAEALP
jgi:hypothetical protein